MRLRQAILILLLSVLVPTSSAQFVNIPHNARSSAMGGCFVAKTDVGSVSLGYRQGFALAGMADKRLSVIWPTGKIGVVGAMYLHHGNIDYHEQQAAVGYAMHPWPWALVGVGGKWLGIGTSDPHYEPQQWLAVTAFFRASIRHTQVAVVVGSRPWDVTRPYSLHLQAQYLTDGNLLTVMEFEQEDCARVHMGMEYTYEKMVMFRAGIATAPLVATFGLGFRHKMFSVDLGAEVHQVLGITPHTTLTLWL